MPKVMRLLLKRWQGVSLMVIILLAGAFSAHAQDAYQKPPQAVLNVLSAPAPPSAIVSPTRDNLLLAEPIRYPGIAEVAQPMLRLAGVRIDPANFGQHNPYGFIHLALVRVADGHETKIALPADEHTSLPSWSPDGRHFSFTIATRQVVELWIGDGRTGAVRKISGIALNSALGAPCEWMPDSHTLLCKAEPAVRGATPAAAAVPTGPTIEESFGRAAPVATFEDLLTDKTDENLFDHYATAQLARVESESGTATPVGKPDIFDEFQAAPDGKHILVARIRRPYSYIVPFERFPHEVEVWDLEGSVEYKLASLPLAETVPIGGVPIGPRDYGWMPTDPATLVWIEALDEGNPKKKVPFRDRVLWLRAPFTAPPAEFAKTEHRFAGLTWGEHGDLAILSDFDRDRLWARSWLMNPQQLSESPRLFRDMSAQDRYRDPGRPQMRVLPSGKSAIAESGDAIFFAGLGASPEGDRPFLDRFDTKTLKSERLFHCDPSSYEEVARPSQAGRL